MLFTGDLSCSGSLERSSILPILHGNPMELPPGRLGVGINDRLDPLLSGTWENTDAQFPAMPQRRIASWKPAKNAKVILSYSNGVPFVVSAPVGSGIVIAVNASADRSWGDFPLSPAFVPIVQQLANLSTAASTGCITRHVGESIPMLPSMPSDQQLTLAMPDGHRIDIPPGEKASLLEHTKMSGFYTVSIPKEGVIAMIAVNPDPKESDLVPATREQIASLLPAEFVAGEEDLKSWLTQSRGSTPIWPSLLLAALAVICLEGMLSNLLVRNRAQGDASHVHTGRLHRRRFGAVVHQATEGVS